MYTNPPLVTRIDLNAIAHNTEVLKRQAGEAQLVCVVKADAYNHGVERCVPVMDAHGADAFGVATLAEARQVRALTDKPVIAWLWSPAEELPEGVELAAPTREHLRKLIDAPQCPTTYLKLDTGMHRSGFDEAEWDEVFAEAAAAERAGKLRVAGLMSHLAAADDPADPYTDTQAERFRDALARARAAGLDPERSHLANSSAAWTRPDLLFGQVRPGLSLYGFDPVAVPDDHAPGERAATPEAAGRGLRPAMTWAARVIAVKRLAAGDPVSYGLTWRAPQDGFTALVPAGYADGIARAWQPNLSVTINGGRYPVVGRVCMDQVVVWLGNNRGADTSGADTSSAPVRAGDEAIIFGEGGASATELAEAVGTIDYEVLCAPKGRTQREYIEEQR